MDRAGDKLLKLFCQLHQFPTARTIREMGYRGGKLLLIIEMTLYKCCEQFVRRTIRNERAHSERDIEGGGICG